MFVPVSQNSVKNLYMYWETCSCVQCYMFGVYELFYDLYEVFTNVPHLCTFFQLHPQNFLFNFIVFLW